ncbi:MAG: hypothetical protein AAF658_01740 [Myxococcota bacterium]
MIHALLMTPVAVGAPSDARATPDGPWPVSFAKRPAQPKARLLYVRLGGGAVFGGDVNAGPVMGFGFRFGGERFAVDASSNLFFGLSDEVDATGVDTDIGGSLLKFVSFYRVEPRARSTPFAAFGLSFGGVALAVDRDGVSRTLSGRGVQGELAFGYEMLRFDDVQIFTSLDVTLPMFLARADELEGARSLSRYAPTFALSLGLGYSGKGLAHLSHSHRR